MVGENQDDIIDELQYFEKNRMLALKVREYSTTMK